MLDRGFIIRKLIGGMLRVFGEFESGMFGDCSFDGGEVTGDQVEQGGFTGTVVSHDGDSIVSSEDNMSFTEDPPTRWPDLSSRVHPSWTHLESISIPNDKSLYK